MLLKTLFKDIPHLLPSHLENQDIKSLQTFSRDAQKKDVFIAIKGSRVDGHSFLKEVLSRKAFVIKNSDYFYESSASEAERIIDVPNTQEILAPLSKAFFGYPDASMIIIGITGTNGKTTTSFMVQNLLETAKKWKIGLIGTINNKIGDDTFPAQNTTPDAFALYALLKKMKDAQCRAVVMEISSHALALNRTGFLDLDMAIFTNISREHLDFHKSMEAYSQAKLRLFDLLETSSKPNKCAIYPQDSPLSHEISLRLSHMKPTVEQSYRILKTLPPSQGTPQNQFSAYVDSSNMKGSQGRLYQGENPIGHFFLPFPGYFNIQNFLGSFLCARYFDVPLTEYQNSLQNLRIPGRFENVAPPSYPFSIIVDYAHTPDALENILQTAKNLNPHQIILVFGCGGDRDKTKRSLMGGIAAQWADQIFVTSDNPRTEDPFAILDEIAKGIPPTTHAYVQKIVNRKTAILRGIEKLSSNDIMIIAGKGHEEYQIFKSKTIPFSDRNIVTEILKEKGDFPWK